MSSPSPPTQQQLGQQQPTVLKRKYRARRRQIHSMAYEIISMILTMNQEQNSFLKKTEGKKSTFIRREYDEVNEEDHHSLITLNHRYHLKKSITGINNITKRLDNGRSYQTVLNSVKYLQMIGLLTYLKERRSYTVTNKGLEFLIIFEDMQRVFPFPEQPYWSRNKYISMKDRGGLKNMCPPPPPTIDDEEE